MSLSLEFWRGPDPSLARMCQCDHNLAQHTYSRGHCTYRERCGCSRFTPTAPGGGGADNLDTV